VAATSPTVTSAPPQGAWARFKRTLKVLFYEVAGAVFAVLALAWLNLTIRGYLTRDASPWFLAMPLVVAALFIFFAVSSFLRARKL
jgi:hypothetical protein